MSGLASQHGDLDRNGDVDVLRSGRPEDEYAARREARLVAALDPDSPIDLAEHLLRITAELARTDRSH